MRGKNVIITGTSRGIGKKMVEVFAREGSNVWAHARQETPEFVDFITSVAHKFQVTVTPVYCDMQNSEAVKDCAKRLVRAAQEFDVLVNNAGIAHGGLTQMTSVSVIRQVFEVNLFAVMEFTQPISRLMVRQKSGSIINMASIAGIDLHAGNCAYGASKAALIAYTKTLSAELAPLGVRVNAIAPGLTATDMAGLMEEKASVTMVAESSMNRLAQPEEIAELALFLASDKASFITGQVIRCDGGKR